LRIKRPECEVDHSRAPSAEVKKVADTPSVPHTALSRGA
jgi:hypothetical protein